MSPPEVSRCLLVVLMPGVLDPRLLRLAEEVPVVRLVVDALLAVRVVEVGEGLGVSWVVLGCLCPWWSLALG
jgi:hypothetical protein